MNKQDIIHDTDGIQLIEGCSGSGKTAMLASRITALIKKHNINPPNDILAVTFTREAAKEMRRRLHYPVNCSTVHSFCLQLITNELRSGKWYPYRILSSAKRIYYLKQAAKAMRLTDYALGDISLAITRAKNALSDTTNDEVIDMLWKVYEYRKRRTQGKPYEIDYDDYMLIALNLLEDDEIHKKYIYKYVLVDEAHDLSISQHAVVDKLHNSNLALFTSAIQCIYSWRVAYPEVVLNIWRQYPQAKHHALSDNYRSDKRIVTFANHIARKSKYYMDMRSVTQGKGLVKYYKHYKNIEDEVHDAVTRLKSKDSAILYRTNWYGMYVEKVLREQGISYHVLGDNSFFKLPEIQHMIAYMQLSVNPEDIGAFEKVYNVPSRYLGQKWHEKFNKLIQDEYTISEALRHKVRGRKYWYEHQGNLLYNISIIQQICRTSPEVLKWVRENMKYDEWVIGNSAREDNSVIANLDEFTKLSTVYEDKQTFINMCADIKSTSGIAIGTIHQVKGLEFNHVHLVGCTEGILPSINSDDIDEERRLLYVAITRAKHIFTYSSASYKNFNKLSDLVKSQTM